MAIQDLFSIKVSKRDDAVVVHVTGELDASTAPELGSTVANVPAETRLLVVNLAGVSFLDSTGISVLVHAERVVRRRGGEFRLVVKPGTDAVRRVLEITKLVSPLGVVDSLAAAFA